MKHRLPTLLAAFWAAAAADPSGAAERPPNIFYLMSDELAYYEVGHMGNPRLNTPNIDRFAAEGSRFTQGLAGKPFFAYFPVTPPRGIYDIPTDNRDWELSEVNGKDWGSAAEIGVIEAKSK